MNYIGAERFLSQDDKVKKVLLNWWKPELGEQVYSTGISSGEYVLLGTVKNRGYYVAGLDNFDTGIASKEVFIPLLTETQLRNFIEDSGYKYVGINNFLELHDEEVWNIKVFKNMNQFEPDFEFIHNCPLECYWYVALNIIGEME